MEIQKTTTSSHWTLLGAAALFSLAALAADPPATAAPDMPKMQQQMEVMQKQMQAMEKAKTPEERQSLMREHMQTMREHMRTMCEGNGMMGHKGMGMGMNQKDMGGPMMEHCTEMQNAPAPAPAAGK